MQIENLNFHITSYLQYYINLQSPSYAILLRGKWGTGKTWFIRDFIEKHNEEDFLYVSLYGITSFKEIEDNFFSQLHPLLGSKAMKLAGKVFGGILKTALKIDFTEGATKEELTISGGIPNVSVQDFFKKMDNKKIVFDDLERCPIELHNILGYINQLVEGSEMKVIILANEEEIILKDSNESRKEITKYTSVKEKLIGKSFDIAADFESAYTRFSNEVTSPKAIALLLEKKNFIKWIFDIAGYENLRHLHQAIMDFDRFYKFLPSIIESKKGLIDHILQLFFSISFEIRRGELKEEDIPKIFSIDMQVIKNEEKLESWQKVRQKYPVFGAYDHPLNSSQLVNFFKNGMADAESINNTILHSRYFLEENTESWTKLYYFYNLEDSQFNGCVKEVFEKLKNAEYDTFELIQHVVGILSHLSSNNLISTKIPEIVATGKGNVTALVERVKLKTNKSLYNFNTYGLSYLGLEHKEVKEFNNFILSELNKLEQEDYPQQALNLLALMKSNISQFRQDVNVTNITLSKYYNIPIFSFMNAAQFIDAFYEMKNTDKKLLGEIFFNRYREPQFRPLLAPELKWLNEVKKMMIARLDELELGPKKYLVEWFINKDLEHSIKSLVMTI